MHSLIAPYPPAKRKWLDLRVHDKQGPISVKQLSVRSSSSQRVKWI